MSSGGVVGFSLGLIGGGGSILAVPLLLYVVGVGDAHVAIGTSALAVSLNAFGNLIGHWRAGNVKWPCAATFAVAGITGAAIGSTIGKLIDGQQLLFLFALAMIAVGVAAAAARRGGRSRRAHHAADRSSASDHRPPGRRLLRLFRHRRRLFDRARHHARQRHADPQCHWLVASVGRHVRPDHAVNYAVSDLIDWPIAALFIAGGLVGGFFGTRAAMHLAKQRRMLSSTFAGVIIAVAIYMLARTGLPLWQSVLTKMM